MVRIFTVVVLLLACAAIWVAPSTLAQDAGDGYIVQIRSGSCDAPGDGLAQLDPLDLSDTAQIGADSAAVAGSSYSVAPLSLDALTSETSAIVVLDPTTHGVVACGEIGGVLGSDGALAIGIRSANDSGLSGIAYIAPMAGNPAQTGISTFLARTGGGGTGSAASPAMDANAYDTMVRNQLTILVGSLQRINTLFSNPNAGDSSWTSQVTAELFLWKLLYGMAEDVTPPAAYADFDQQYLGALSLMDSAANDIAKALKTNDEDLLRTAIGKVQQAVDALRGLEPSTSAATPTAGTPVP